MKPCKPGPGWRCNEVCRLFVNPETDLQVLHDFAARIDMRPEWFQAEDVVPHYRMNRRRRKAAVAAGAVELHRDRVLNTLRKWQSHTATSQAVPTA
jgi:hypothetical protein